MDKWIYYTPVLYRITAQLHSRSVGSVVESLVRHLHWRLLVINGSLQHRDVLLLITDLDQNLQ